MHYLSKRYSFLRENEVFEPLYVLNTSCLQLMTWPIIIEVYRGEDQTSEMVDPALSGERHATVLRGCKT